MTTKQERLLTTVDPAHVRQQSQVTLDRWHLGKTLADLGLILEGSGADGAGDAEEDADDARDAEDTGAAEDAEAAGDASEDSEDSKDSKVRSTVSTIYCTAACSGALAK